MARELSRDYGVLEPLQTRDSINCQVEELAEVLSQHGILPNVLIGWSYGAALSYIFTAYHPTLVKKLIMIGATSYEEKYTVNIVGEELSRLSEEERVEVFDLADSLQKDDSGDKSAYFGRICRLFLKADSYDLLPEKDEVLEYQPKINGKISREVWDLLASGELLDLGAKVKCPVTVIQGDYDPRFAEGVREPLNRVLNDFKFILLDKCGHTPWLEKFARDKFFEVLKEEIKDGLTGGK